LISVGVLGCSALALSTLSDKHSASLGISGSAF
jgi:hypothetical protein